MKQIRLPKIRRPKLSNPRIRLPKLGGPKIRMPKLKGSGFRTPKFRGPKLSGPKLSVPPFVENLYRDMRDRRLLLPAIGLLIALLAVPILLKSTSSSEPAPTPPTAADASAEAVQPAVLTQQLGVTDYRRRLDDLQSKNPFRQHFVLTPTASGAGTTSTGSTTPSSGGQTFTGGSSAIRPSSTSSTPSGSSFSSSGSTGSAVPSSSGTSSPSPAPSSGSSGGTATHQHHHSTEPSLFYIRRQIDVKVGTPDNFREKDGVERISFLPNASHPVVVYLGANRSATRAVFQVSSDVTSVSGTGRCFPSEGNCQYLVLKKGQIEHFDYSGTAYKLKLLRIRTIVSNNLGGEKPKPKAKGSSGGSALAALRGLVG